jgi:predicted transcriptional regulator
MLTPDLSVLLVDHDTYEVTSLINLDIYNVMTVYDVMTKYNIMTLFY